MHSSSWDFYCRPTCSGNKMVQQYLPTPELHSISSCPWQKFGIPSPKSSFLVRLLFWLPFFILQRMRSFIKNIGLTDIKAFATLLWRLELHKLTCSKMVSGVYLSFQWSRKTKSRVSTSYFFFSWGIISSEGPSRSFTWNTNPADELWTINKKHMPLARFKQTSVILFIARYCVSWIIS